jgi:hypothetical protein
MAIEVVPLAEADIPGVIEVIQQAFADDPYFKWVFDAPKVHIDPRNHWLLPHQGRLGRLTGLPRNAVSPTTLAGTPLHFLGENSSTSKETMTP